MPDQALTTEPSDPSTSNGGGSLAPYEAKVAATEALLDVDGVGIRAPSLGEGALMWELARDAGGLDLNSPYAYMVAGRHFQSTCAIAEVYGKPAGFVMAHRIPSRPDVLFIWQVAVVPDFRGLGIAKRMFDNLLAREANAGVRTMEATVTSSNKASAALFAAFAKSRNAELDVRTGFTAADFPDGHGHEAEALYVIAPISDIT
ncbi:MAG: diaminobutyrate acetyltransferase [Rhodospirillales bacterium]